MMAVHARLLFDSEQTSGMMGVRSLATADRSLLFSAGPLAVDLVMYGRAGEMLVVHGQLVSRDCELPIAGASVRLGATGEAVESDALGQFSVSGTAPFDEVLSITVSGEEIHCAIPVDDTSCTQ